MDGHTRGPAARVLPRFIDLPGGQFCYSFRHGPMAGVVLDTGEDKPYAQLIGGGPKPEAATLIRGSVTQSRLTLTLSDLDGRELAAWSAEA